MPLGISSIFGTAKATQEADMVLILQRPSLMNLGNDPQFNNPWGPHGNNSGGMNNSGYSQKPITPNSYYVSMGGNNNYGGSTLMLNNQNKVDNSSVTTNNFSTYLEIKKNRYDGTLGRISLQFNPKTMSFYES